MADFYSGLSGGLATGAAIGSDMARQLREDERGRKLDQRYADDLAHQRGREARQDARQDEQTQLARDTAGLGFVQDELTKNLAASAEYLQAGKKDDPALAGLTTARRDLKKKRDDLRARITGGDTYRSEHQQAAEDWQVLQGGGDASAMPSDRFYRMMHHLGTVEPEAYLRRNGQPSKVDQILGEVQSAVQQGDMDAAFKAAGPLIQPYFEVGYGEKAEDGSVKTRKTPTALYPAQDDPDSVYIGLDVETKRADGAAGRKHALMTKGQGHDATDEPVKVPVSRLMDLLGQHAQLLDEINDNPVYAQKIDEAMASGAGQQAQDAYEAFIADGGRLEADYKKTESAARAKKYEADARLADARAKNVGKTGAGGGRASADIQMLERLGATLYAGEKDPKKRERMALDELARIKKMTQKSSGREEFVARMIATQSALKTQDVTGEQKLVWQGRQQDMLDYVTSLADQVYGKGGVAADEGEAGDGLTDDEREELEELRGTQE